MIHQKEKEVKDLIENSEAKTEDSNLAKIFFSILNVKKSSEISDELKRDYIRFQVENLKKLIKEEDWEHFVELEQLLLELEEDDS